MMMMMMTMMMMMMMMMMMLCIPGNNPFTDRMNCRPSGLWRIISEPAVLLVFHLALVTLYKGLL